MKYATMDFVRAFPKETKKTIAIKIIDASISGLIFFAFIVLVTGIIYMIG